MKSLRALITLVVLFWFLVPTAQAETEASPARRMPAASFDTYEHAGRLHRRDRTVLTGSNCKCIQPCDPCVRWIFTIPLWVPSVSAQTADGSVTVETDRDLGDLVDKGDRIVTGLEFAFVGQVTAQKGRWGLSVDAYHAAIGSTADFKIRDGPLSFNATGDLKATIARLRVDYLYTRAALPWQVRRCGPAEHRVYVGVRTYDIDVKADFTGIARTASISDFWVDPIIGVQSEVPFARKWALVFRGDIGGFGIGSDLSYTLLAGVHWRFACRWGVTFAWSILDVRKTEGVGASLRKWDVELSGPHIGISFFI